MTENTVEISAEELAALRAAADQSKAVETSTRDRSPVKPQDHKPSVDKLVSFEFEGTKFTAARGAVTKLSNLDLLERGFMNTAIRKIVGDEAYQHFLDANPDANEETAGKLLEAVAEATGAKN